MKGNPILFKNQLDLVTTYDVAQALSRNIIHSRAIWLFCRI